MERRYLVATVALALTFGLVSHGLRSGYLSRVPHSRAQLAADVACARQYVAEMVVSKLEPYIDRQPVEEAQMVAELNLPELVQAQREAADADALLAQQIARQKCEAAERARRIPQQIYEMRVLSGVPAIKINVPAVKIDDLAIVRAEELSARAQQWQTLMNERTLNIQLKSLENAQKISARAMERAQRAVERSRCKMNVPSASGVPIHINFTGPTPMIVIPAAPAAPEVPSATIE